MPHDHPSAEEDCVMCLKTHVNLWRVSCFEIAQSWCNQTDSRSELKRFVFVEHVAPPAVDLEFSETV